MIQSSPTDKAYGAFVTYQQITCLRELYGCLRTCSSMLRENKLQAAQETLHQMIGSSRILGSDLIERSIHKIKAAIKENDAESRMAGLREVKRQLGELHEELSRRRDRLNILAIGPGVSTIKQNFSGDDSIESFTSIKDLSEVEKWIGVVLPDVLLVLGSMDEKCNERLEEIESRYLGTKLLRVKPSGHNSAEVSPTKLRSMVRQSALSI